MKKPEDFGITKYDKEKFEKTGILDCFQSVYLRDRNLKKIPFQFGIVDGYFDCSHNQLKSLEGCPQEVKGDFYCYENQLKSLEGCPKEVNGFFDCSNNQLKSLEGSPREVQGNIYCHNNPFDITTKEWINYLEKYQKGNLYKSCRIVPDNSTHESTLKCLKEKLSILEAFD